MESHKIINYSEVSLVLTGNKSTIRANRKNQEFSEPLKELISFLNTWVSKNSKSKNAVITKKNNL